MMTDDDRLLSYEDLKGFGIKYCRMQLWRRENEGTFPQRVRLGGNRIAWCRSEILAWLRGLGSTIGHMTASSRIFS